MILLRSVADKMMIEICGHKGATETEILMRTVSETGQPKQSKYKVEKSSEGTGNNSLKKSFQSGLKSYRQVRC